MNDLIFYILYFIINSVLTTLSITFFLTSHYFIFVIPILLSLYGVGHCAAEFYVRLFAPWIDIDK